LLNIEIAVVPNEKGELACGAHGFKILMEVTHQRERIPVLVRSVPEVHKIWIVNLASV
jgi:hypothetical protein